MSITSLNDFLNNSAQRDRSEDIFELENDRCLEVKLQSTVWTKTGSMVAYLGNIKFVREGILEHGIGKMLKKAVTGEGTKLTKAEGVGRLYLADSGKKITLMRLNNETIFVNANDLLAFEPSVQWDIKMMRKLAAVVSGGLFNVKLSGTGMVAITTHFDPLTLRVTPQWPVMTDPNATVAWGGNLTPEFRTDISFKTFLGRGSGESIQMEFKGDGFVVVQPFEEIYMQHAGG